MAAASEAVGASAVALPRSALERLLNARDLLTVLQNAAGVRTLVRSGYPPPPHTHTQDHMDGGDDEGVHHDAQDGGDAAAKRHRKCPRYNEQQLRKLEAFYPIRDR